MSYTICKKNDDKLEAIDNSEFIGAKPIRKHYQSAIRALLDHHDTVTITISNSHTSREFVIRDESKHS